MDIALVRVDNRLIHGQILEAWLPFTGASRIVVVDDRVAGDFFHESVIRMAVPDSVDVIIISVEEFARNYADYAVNGQKAIVLFGTIADVLRAYKLGFKFNRLNIGNVESGDECGQSCSPSVVLGKNDIDDLLTLLNLAGVHIEMRRVPRETAVNIMDIIKKVAN
ncbi:MAG: PTS sugar transporter subunit IIB [Deltaproteobacteria bacterium]|jgi:PTS system mannose-specific IIB component|nr:PTS sugar transporter subunit IIB [Deltaproteobacteria bacterium]